MRAVFREIIFARTVDNGGIGITWGQFGREKVLIIGAVVEMEERPNFTKPLLISSNHKWQLNIWVKDLSNLILVLQVVLALFLAYE